MPTNFTFLLSYAIFETAIFQPQVNFISFITIQAMLNHQSNDNAFQHIAQETCIALQGFNYLHNTYKQDKALFISHEKYKR